MKNNPRITVSMTGSGAYAVDITINNKSNSFLYFTPGEMVTGVAYHLRNNTVNDYKQQLSPHHLYEDLLLTSSLFMDAVEFYKAEYNRQTETTASFRRTLQNLYKQLKEKKLLKQIKIDADLIKNT